MARKSREQGAVPRKILPWGDPSRAIGEITFREAQVLSQTDPALAAQAACAFGGSLLDLCIEEVVPFSYLRKVLHYLTLASDSAKLSTESQRIAAYQCAVAKCQMVTHGFASVSYLEGVSDVLEGLLPAFRGSKIYPKCAMWLAQAYHELVIHHLIDPDEASTAVFYSEEALAHFKVNTRDYIIGLNSLSTYTREAIRADRITVNELTVLIRRLTSSLRKISSKDPLKAHTKTNLGNLITTAVEEGTLDPSHLQSAAKFLSESLAATALDNPRGAGRIARLAHCYRAIAEEDKASLPEMSAKFESLFDDYRERLDKMPSNFISSRRFVEDARQFLDYLPSMIQAHKGQ